MTKKGQGISLNVIIIAAIALLVLVILSVIFLGRMGGFGKGVADVEKEFSCNKACTIGGYASGTEVTGTDCGNDVPAPGTPNIAEGKICCCQK